MNLIAPLDRVSAIVSGLDQLVRQLVPHRAPWTLAGEGDQPPHSKCHAALVAHFDRNLVVGATDPPALYFHHGLAVLESAVEDLERLFTCTLDDNVQRSVNNLLSNGFLAVQHNDVHELGDELIPVLGIVHHRPLGHFATTWHD